MMNAAAAAYVAYGEMVSEGASRLGLAPKTRRMPVWLIGRFFGLYGLAILMILCRARTCRGRLGRLRALCAGQRVLAVIAGGGCRPLRRDQASTVMARGTRPTAQPRRSPAGRRARRADQPYALDPDLGRRRDGLPGDGHHLHPGRRDPDAAVHPQRDRLVAGPTTFFVGATLALHRHASAAGGSSPTDWSAGRSSTCSCSIFGLSMTDYDFRDIVTKPDNVPIVGLLILVGYFDWFALRRAVINDARIAQGLPDPRRPRAREDPDLARPGLHRADLHGAPDDRPGRLGDRPPGAARAAGQLDGRPQPVQGALVLPGPPGDAGLLRSLDGRRACCPA